MARVKFTKGTQGKFLKSIQEKTHLTCGQLAKLCNICERTFRDWRRERYKISYIALSSLCKAAKVSMPKNIKVMTEYWNIKKAASLGAKKRYELYGAPGNIESRRKGGINSAKKLLQNPQRAKEIGVTIRKQIAFPAISELLAEFIGIIFGDGGVTDYQVSVYFNKVLDRPYADYVAEAVQKLFSVESSIHYKKTENTGKVVVSSRNLVELLAQYGIKNGNKTKWGNIPDWIWQEKKYQAAYLRGLMDTDGCIYRHKYKVNGKWYNFAKIAFTSYSAALREIIRHMLENLNFSPKVYGNRVYLYKQEEVHRYFKEIKTHNPRYLKRYKDCTLN